MLKFEPRLEARMVMAMMFATRPMMPKISSSLAGTSGGSNSRRIPSMAAYVPTTSSSADCPRAAITSIRRNPQVRLELAGLSISVPAISATSRPTASVMAWAVSVSSARLPVMTEPMAWATTIVAVIENAIQSFLRKSPGCPVSLAAGP